MSQILKVAFAAAAVAVAALSLPSDAAARGRLYPLTQCGPDLAYLCPIHGYYDAPPFHYNLAIYPGCIQTQNVDTPNGVRRRRVVVCG
jgi:hypothetical protein